MHSEPAANIYQGNATADGRDFSSWFVGDLERWCALNGVPFEPSRHGLRSTQALEIKWGLHRKGDPRPGGWTGPSPRMCLSLLVQGDFMLKFRLPESPEQETTYRMTEVGDYLLWREDGEHTWMALEDSIILTVRWPV